MNDLIRVLVREEIARILNDDALFRKHDSPGLEKDFTVPGDHYEDYSNLGDTNIDHGEAFSADCEVCGDTSCQCDHPGWSSSCTRNDDEENEQYYGWMKRHIAQSEQMLEAVCTKLGLKSSNYHE